MKLKYMNLNIAVDSDVESVATLTRSQTTHRAELQDFDPQGDDDDDDEITVVDDGNGGDGQQNHHATPHRGGAQPPAHTPRGRKCFTLNII